MDPVKAAKATLTLILTDLLKGHTTPEQARISRQDLRKALGNVAVNQAQQELNDRLKNFLPKPQLYLSVSDIGIVLSAFSCEEEEHEDNQFVLKDVERPNTPLDITVGILRNVLTKQSNIDVTIEG